MAIITLTWQESVGAVSYKIYHNTSPNLSVVRTPLLATTTALTFEHTNLVNHSVHYYIVIAIGPNGETSAPSEEISVTAEAGTLVSIVVTPVNLTIFVPNTHQYTATGHFSSGPTQDITSTVVWASDNTTAATIAASGGLVTVHHAGVASISATLGLISGSTGLDVEISLTSIAVTPTNPTINVDDTQQMVATGTYSDSSTANITNSVAWSSGTTIDATVNSAGLVTGIAGGSTVITATSGLISGNTTVTINSSSATETKLYLCADQVIHGEGDIQPFRAIQLYSDGSTIDVTDSVTWGNTDPSVLADFGSGNIPRLFAIESAGTTIISADDGYFSNSITVTLTQPSPVVVNPNIGDNIIYVEGMANVNGTLAFINNGYYFSTSDGNTESAVYYSTDQGVTLNPVTTIDPFFLVNGGDGGYSSSCIWYSGDVAFVVGDAASEGSATTGNMYSSTDGINWSAIQVGPLHSGIPTETLIGIHGIDDSNIWAVSNSNVFTGGAGQYAANSSVYNSTDGGATWTNIFTITGADSSHRSVYALCIFVIDPSDIWVGGNRMLWHYDGVTWTNKTTTLNTAAGYSSWDINSIYASSTSDVWFVSSINLEPNIFRTTDQGTTFSTFDLHTQTGSNGGMWQVAGTDSSNIYVVGYAHSGHANWLVTHDSGTTWTQVDTLLTGSDDLTMIYIENSNNIWVGGQPLVHYAPNAIVVESPKIISEINLVPPSAVQESSTTLQLAAIATYTDGTTGDVTSLVDVWASEDPTIVSVDGYGLTTFHNVGTTIVSGTISTFTCEPGLSILGSIRHWVEQTSNTANNLNHVFGFADDNIYAVGDNGTIVNWDGATWNVQTSGTINNLNKVWGSSVTSIWIAGDNGTFLHSTDGTTWTNNTAVFTAFGGTTDAIAVWGSSETNIWALLHDTFLQTTDGGITWGNNQNIGVDGQYTHMWGTDANNIIAVANDGTLAFLNQFGWNSIGADPSNGCWPFKHKQNFTVGSSGGVGIINDYKYQFSGSPTFASDIVPGAATVLNGIHGINNGTLYVVGSDNVPNWTIIKPESPLGDPTTPQTWAVESIPSVAGQGNGVWVNTTLYVVAVGDNGVIMAYVHGS